MFARQEGVSSPRFWLLRLDFKAKKLKILYFFSQFNDVIRNFIYKISIGNVKNNTTKFQENINGLHPFGAQTVVLWEYIFG